MAQQPVPPPLPGRTRGLIGLQQAPKNLQKIRPNQEIHCIWNIGKWNGFLIELLIELKEMTFQLIALGSSGMMGNGIYLFILTCNRIKRDSLLDNSLCFIWTNGKGNRLILNLQLNNCLWSIWNNGKRNEFILNL